MSAEVDAVKFFGSVSDGAVPRPTYGDRATISVCVVVRTVRPAVTRIRSRQAQWSDRSTLRKSGTAPS